MPENELHTYAYNQNKFSCHTDKNTFFFAKSHNAPFYHDWEYSHGNQWDCGSPISLNGFSSDPGQSPWKHMPNFHLISVKL